MSAIGTWRLPLVSAAISALVAILLATGGCGGENDAPPPSGPTIDAIAKKMGAEECRANVIKEREPGSDAFPGARVTRDARQVVFISCGGEVPPSSTYMRFPSAAIMRGALARADGRERINSCRLGREAFTGGYVGHAQLCKELGGSRQFDPSEDATGRFR